MKIFFNELLEVYESLMTGKEVSLPPLELTCREFLLERSRIIMNSDYEKKHYTYWENKFKEYLIPVDKRPLYRSFGVQEPPAGFNDAKKDFDKARWFIYITAFENKQAMHDLAGVLGITAQVALLATFFMSAHISFETDKILAASPIPGRDKRSRQIIGNLFGNIFLKSVVNPSMTLKEVMMKMYMDFLQSCRYPVFEFEKFDPFETRDKCEFFVNYLDVNDRKDIKTAMPDNYVHKPEKEYYSLSYIVYEYKNGFTFRWAYQTDIYTREIIECLAGLHLQVLACFLKNPETSMGELSHFLRGKDQKSVAG